MVLQILQDVNKYESIAWVSHEIMLTEINSMEHDMNAYTEGNMLFFKILFLNCLKVPKVYNCTVQPVIYERIYT